MYTGKTQSGFEFSVNDNAKDDMELLDALIDIDDGDTSSLKTAIVRLLGKDQKKALYEHCRGEDGIVSASAVLGEFAEILNSLQDDEKN